MVDKNSQSEQNGAEFFTDRGYPMEVWLWFMEVLQLPMLLYGVVPLKVLFKVFDNGAEYGELPHMTLEEFESGVRKFVAMRNERSDLNTDAFMAGGLSFGIYGDDAVSILLEGDTEYISAHHKLTKELKEKLDIDFFIPTREQVDQLVSKGYLDSPEAEKLENYCRKNGFKTDAEVQEFVRHISLSFWQADDPNEILTDAHNRVRDKRKVSNFTIEEFQELASVLFPLQGATPLLDRLGNQQMKLYESRPHNGPTVIVPGSSSYADEMRKNPEAFTKMGFIPAPDATASEFPTYAMGPGGKKIRVGTKKVYPNDPCPCGSGKKYKHCHGAKR